MAIITTDNAHYAAIAAAIRAKHGTSDTYKPPEMAAAIEAISGGGTSEWDAEPPDDGKTRLYIEIPSALRSSISLYFNQSMSNGAEIDWGDGSPVETRPSTGLGQIFHNYNSAGKFIITVNVVTGGITVSGFALFNGGEYGGQAHYYMLNRCVIGNGIVLNNSAFNNHKLLRSVVFPGGITSIGNSMFTSCYALASFIIPDSVLTIGSSAFSSCASLASIIIPASVNTIQNYAFDNCYSMKVIHFHRLAPPTVVGASVFSNIPSDCIFYVPVGSLEAYQTATNLTTHASKMREEGT